MRKLLWTFWALALAIPLYIELFEHLSGRTIAMGVTSLYLVTMAACSAPLFYLCRDGRPKMVRMLFISTTIVFTECIVIGIATWLHRGAAATQ